jgi:hypothetical protein
VAGFATEKAARTSSDGRDSADELKRKIVVSDGRTDVATLYIRLCLIDCSRALKVVDF